MDIKKEMKRLEDLLGKNNSQVNKIINQLPSDKKKILGNAMNDMKNAFKKKDLNLLNNVYDKLTKIAENESKLS